MQAVFKEVTIRRSICWIWKKALESMDICAQTFIYARVFVYTTRTTLSHFSYIRSPCSLFVLFVPFSYHSFFISFYFIFGVSYKIIGQINLLTADATHVK